MKTSKPFTKEPLTEKLREMFLHTQQEVEELVIQLALGKAEAKDKFQEIKKDFLRKLNEWENKNASTIIENSKGKLKQNLDELKVQLALGKSELNEIYEEQIKKLQHYISEIDAELKHKIDLENRIGEFNQEMRIFILKLDVLKLKLQQKKFELTDDFKNAMKDVQLNFLKLYEKGESKIEDTKSRITAFNVEMENVTDYFKKAIGKLRK